MAGGKFYPLMIDVDGHVAPSGPMPMARDEEIIELYSWVIQENEDMTGAFCAAFQDEEGFRRSRNQNEWTTRANAVNRGRFQPGAAVGVAAAISRLGDAEPHLHWWTDSVLLTRAGDRRIGMPGGDGNRRIVELIEEILNILRGGGGPRLQAGQGFWNPAVGGGGDGRRRVATLLEEALRIL